MVWWLGTGTGSPRKLSWHQVCQELKKCSQVHGVISVLSGDVLCRAELDSMILKSPFHSTYTMTLNYFQPDNAHHLRGPNEATAQNLSSDIKV